VKVKERGTPIEEVAPSLSLRMAAASRPSPAFLPKTQYSTFTSILSLQNYSVHDQLFSLSTPHYNQLHTTHLTPTHSISHHASHDSHHAPQQHMPRPPCAVQLRSQAVRSRPPRGRTHLHAHVVEGDMRQLPRCHRPLHQRKVQLLHHVGVSTLRIVEKFFSKEWVLILRNRDNNCSGKVTSSGGPSMPYLVKDSRSWYCIE
jgi:hypothetical protein